MGRRVDDDEAGPLFPGRTDFGLNAWRGTVDHLWRPVAAPRAPLAGSSLRIGIDDERDGAENFSGGGKVHGQGSFARTALLADNGNDGHGSPFTCGHADVWDCGCVDV